MSCLLYSITASPTPGIRLLPIKSRNVHLQIPTEFLVTTTIPKVPQFLISPYISNSQNKTLDLFESIMKQVCNHPSTTNI